MRSDWSKTHVYQSIKHGQHFCQRSRKVFSLKFSAKQTKVLKKRLTNQINKNEAKTVEKSQFIDLFALLLLLAACKIYIIKQMKKPKQCITLL